MVSSSRSVILTPAWFFGIWAAGRNLGAFGSQDRSEGITVAFAPDGKHVVTVNWAGGRRGESCPVTLWDAQKREKIRSLDEDVNDTLFFSAAITSDGKTLALGGGFNRRGGPMLACICGHCDRRRNSQDRRTDRAGRQSRMSGIVTSMAYAPTGARLLCSPMAR